MRTLFRSAVFLTWAAVMAALAASSLLARGPATALRPLPAEASEQWYGVYSQGRKSVTSTECGRPPRTVSPWRARP